MGRKSVGRRDGEFVVLPSLGITIVLRIVRGQIRLIVDAPDEVPIRRGEETDPETGQPYAPALSRLADEVRGRRDLSIGSRPNRRPQ